VRVKAITVPKEKTQEVLKRKELRILDRKYEVLMPPLDDMEKNTIDAQGFFQLVNEFLNYMIFSPSPGQKPSTFAEIVIYTNSNNRVTLQFAGQMSSNSQGVIVLNQAFSSNNSMNIQYYFVGFDTTNSSYQGSSLELYVIAIAFSANPTPYYTNLIRIAYASLSVNKTPNENLFIVWLIEYQGVPYYLLIFIPTFASLVGIIAYTIGTPISITTYTIYGYNGSCNLVCNGNCPSATSIGYVITMRNGTPTVQIPAIMPVGNGVSSAQVLMCSGITYAIATYDARFGTLNNVTSFNLSSSYPVNVALSPSDGTFYVYFLTLTITYQVS